MIAVGGALGSLGRHGVSEWSRRRLGETFPYGTLFVNLAGSLVLGLVLGLALAGSLSKSSKAAVGIGFLGAFTTFSTFSCDTVLLLERGKVSAAFGNIAANLIIGVAAAWLGFLVARSLA